jgi:sugar-specific transcriptional regulator TrmB
VALVYEALMKRDSPLHALGITTLEQKVYEALLANPGAFLTEVARHARNTKSTTARTLKALEIKGLANRLPERTPRYYATPPDVAIDLLFTKRQDELQRARALAQRWQGRQRPAPDNEQPIEIVSGRDAIMHRFQHMHRSSRSEIVCFERPPYVVSATYHYADVQKDAMARGVGLRTIIDPSVLDIPGKLESLKRNIAHGEHIRVLPRMPLKMLIADRRLALVPLSLEQARDIALVLRTSLLLDALCELFETLWERATPFGTAAVSVRTPERARRLVDGDTLVSLLAAGMNDKSIAQELGISARTLERRILELLKALDAKTRFQAGWQSAHRTRLGGGARAAHPQAHGEPRAFPEERET